MKKTFTFALYILLCSVAYSQTEPEYSIAPWLGNKKAAVSITFDDNEDGQFSHALPVMQEKGIKATFFVITSSVENKNQWNVLQDAIDKGFEIGSHSASHPNDITKLDNSALEAELKDSHDAIMKHLKGQSHLCIAWPFGKGGGSSRGDSIARSIAGTYYFAARNAGAGIAGVGDSYNHYLNPFFNAPGRNYYLQTGGILMAPETTKENMEKMISQLIEVNGWSVPFYHGIETGGYNNISKEEFTTHMDVLLSFKNDIWITTFGNASKYHHQRNAEAALSAVSENANEWVLSLTDTLSRDDIFNHPLTIRLKTPDFAVNSITQGVQTIPFIIDGDSIQFDAIPDSENIVFHKETMASIGQTLLEETRVCHFPDRITVLSPANIHTANLFTPNGELVKRIPLSNKTGEIIIIERSELAKGCYFLMLNEADGHRITYKIIN